MATVAELKQKSNDTMAELKRRQGAELRKKKEDEAKNIHVESKQKETSAKVAQL